MSKAVTIMLAQDDAGRWYALAGHLHLKGASQASDADPLTAVRKILEMGGIVACPDPDMARLTDALDAQLVARRTRR